MSFAYGAASKAKLATCHQTLEDIAERALELSPYDITIVHGWRGEEVQNALFDSGASKKRWPDSEHNHTDELDQSRRSRSLSVSITHIFAVIAGCFMAAAKDFGETLRWGGDWDSDGSTTDQTLMDWGHVELEE